MTKNYIDLFSGIGGFALGAKWAGLEFDNHYFSEVDEYAIKVYQKRFPKAAALGDIRKIDYAALPKGDWYASGGFPCQPHSCIGQRKAGADERDLWAECARMLRELRPRFALFENVTGLFTSERGRFFNGVLRDIHESGYDAEWQVLQARDFGAPHKRERVWITAYPASNGRREIQEGEKATYPKVSGKEHPQWEHVQFKTARNYTVQLREGDEHFVCGMDDGLPDWLDRLKCCGNAIVPQIAAHLWGRVASAE